MPLSLEEQFGATHAATQFAQLAALDRVWTDYLTGSSSPIPPSDVRTLERLTDAMTQLLREATDRAGYLDTIVSGHTRELEEEYRHFLDDEEKLTEEQRRLLRERVEAKGGIVAYARQNATYVLNRAPLELEELTAKMDTIRSGGFTPGDLGTNFICGLAGGCITGGFFAPFPANIIGVAAGIAIVAGVYASGKECS